MARAPSALNVPNTLTLLRLACLPAIVALFRAGLAAAAPVFLIVMLTDCFDGWLARRLNQCTALGVYLDPVVDKIVVIALFYELACAGFIPLAIPHLVLARELLQNAVRALGATRGTVVGANWMGKTKATLQILVLAWGLALPALCREASGGGLQTALQASAWAVLLLSWVFLAVFAHHNRRLFTARN